MNVVVVDIVMEQELARIPPQPVSAMIIDRLCAAECEQQCCLAGRHPGERLCDDGSKGIEDESFDWMVVECTESKGDVESVVDGVEVSIEESRGVECAV